MIKNCGEQCEIDRELINLRGNEDMNKKEKQSMNSDRKMKEWRCIRNYKVDPEAKQIVGRDLILCNNHPRTKTAFDVQHKMR